MSVKKYSLKKTAISFCQSTFKSENSDAKTVLTEYILKQV